MNDEQHPDGRVMRVLDELSFMREPKALEPPAPPERPGEAAALLLDQHEEDHEQAGNQISTLRMAGRE